jgi:hypothetical protein
MRSRRYRVTDSPVSTAPLARVIAAGQGDDLGFNIPGDNLSDMHELATAFNSSYLVALLMGLFTAMHCLGMCGAVIGSLSLSLDRSIREQPSRLLRFVLSYNLGRICSYSIGGLFAGLLQHVMMLPFDEGQGYRFLQIVSAMVMAAAGFHIMGWFPHFAYIERVGGQFWRRVEPYGRRLLPVQTLPQAFVFGMVWGWLPCGLVYAALALAAATGDVERSTLTMFAFGLGTLPVVAGVGIMTSQLVRLSRMNRFRQLAGLTLVALALLAAFPWINPMMRHGLH